MFGIGTPELLVILVLALVVVGPERLPEIGRTVGRVLREFRKVQDDVRDMVQTGLGSDLDDVRKELRGTADELRKTSRDIASDVKGATDVKPLLPSVHRSRRPRSPSQRLKAAGAAMVRPPASPHPAEPAGESSPSPSVAAPAGTEIDPDQVSSAD